MPRFEYLVRFGDSGGRARSYPVHLTQDGGKTTLCGLKHRELPLSYRWGIYRYSGDYEPVGICSTCMTLLKSEHDWRHPIRAENLRPADMISRLACTRKEWFPEAERTLEQLANGLIMTRQVLEKAKIAIDELEAQFKDDLETAGVEFVSQSDDIVLENLICEDEFQRQLMALLKKGR